MIGSAEERLRELDRMYPSWEEDTLWTRFEKTAARFQKHSFIAYQDQEYTYGAAREEIKLLARSLYACGVREGHHVAVLLYNSPEYVFLTFALSMLGAVKVPVNMKLSAEEKAYIIRQSDSTFVISHSGKLLPGGDTLSSVTCVVIRYSDPESEREEGFLDWSRFLYLGQESEQPPVATADSSRISDILYTSGSTTFPKGVLLTQDMLLRSSFGTCRTRRMEWGRRILVPIPLYHIFAYNEGLLAALWVGGCIILTDRKSTGAYLARLLQKQKANDIICVPILMIQLLEALGEEKREFPDLHAGYWASTCPDWVWGRAREELGITDVTTGYGMTECGSTTTMFSPGCTTQELMEYQGYLKDCGCAGEGGKDGKLLELEIRDLETGERLPAGKSGELYCRGFTVTKGYYGRPELGTECFDREGWFATGDVGVLDEKGRFSFQGRKDALYKINGENVSPQHINYVIGGCRQVKAVEAVGIKSARYGEIGVAFIDPVQDSQENRQGIVAHITAHLADFQTPRYLVLSDSRTWPRTSCGKISPGALKKEAAKRVEFFEKEHSSSKRKEIVWI